MLTLPVRQRALSAVMLTVALAFCPGSTRAADLQALHVPAAPGSVSPNLAAKSGGRVILSWIEPEAAGHALKFASLDGDAFGPPARVAGGADWFVNWADFPSVVSLGGERLAAHWLVRQPAGGYAYDVAVALSDDDGRTWSPPIRPHDDGTPTEHGFVTLFPQGGQLGLIWLDGREMAAGGHDEHGNGAMTLRAATVTTFAVRDEQVIDQRTCDCCQTDVAAIDDGLIAVYRDRSDGEIRDIFASRRVNGRWDAGRAVATDNWQISGCPVNGPVASAAGARVAVAWFEAADGTPEVRASFSDDGGSSFADAITVARGDNHGRVGAVLLPDGDLAVSWLGTSADGSGGVLLARVSAAGTVGRPVLVSAGDRVPLLSVPQLALRGDRLIVAWTASRAEHPMIRSARVRIAAL